MCRVRKLFERYILKQLFTTVSVNSGEYLPRRFASRSEISVTITSTSVQLLTVLYFEMPSNDNVYQSFIQYLHVVHMCYEQNRCAETVTYFELECEVLPRLFTHS